MSTTTAPMENVICDQLARGEMRLLSLVVAVRKSSGLFSGVKGDLSAAVKTALRKLVNAKVVIDVDGVYSLQKKAD